MSTNVVANGRSILHKGHGMTHTCAVPDVCKTPSPGGPIPIPYVNVAMDSNLTDGASTVTIEGNPLAKVSSKIATSTGDEPGSAGGIISSKFKGAMTWKMGSLDVKAEGDSVVRFLDTAFHNGNSFNTSFINVGEPKVAYGDDAPCPKCKKPTEKHVVHATDEVKASIAKLFEEMKKIFDAQKDAILDGLRTDAVVKILNGKKEPIKRALKSAGYNAELAARKARYDAAKAALAGSHLLVWDKATNFYTMGFMVGVCLCKCGTKKLASASGDITPGFRQAVANAGFALGPTMPAMSPNQASNVTGGEKWQCAAPKMINALEGHKPRSMVEQYYQPSGSEHVLYQYRTPPGPDGVFPENFREGSFSKDTAFPRPGREGVDIEYDETVDGVTTRVTKTFKSGDACPSCDKCQLNMPELLCDKDEPCP